MSNPISNPPRSQRDIPTWQRVLWTLLPIVSLTLAAWVPFVYWANRRNYGSRDQRWWIGFAAATVVAIILAATLGGDDNTSLSALSGGYTITLMLAAAVMTWIKLSPKRM